MPLISQSIPSLVGGISQQPPVFRRDSQCQDSVNAYSDPVSGVKKRTGTQFIQQMVASPDSDFFSIDRDGAEKYILAVSPLGIEVFDKDGNIKLVSGDEAAPYLSGTEEYKTLTVADTTFIVNPNKRVSMKPTLSPTSTNTGLVFVTALAFSNTYTVNITGPGIAVNATYTTAASGPLNIESVSSSLSSQLNGAAGVTAQSVGGVIKYQTTSPVSIKGFTALGESYMRVIPGTTRNFGDLPAIGFPDVIIKITGDIDENRDDYYVKFSETSPGNGVWRETIAPGIEYELDPSTMPHVLQRQPDGSFVFQPFTWADRVTGDADSNPLPSFVGNTISNIVYHRDRLAFLSDTNVIMSEANGLANFFRTSVSTIIDSDPIDLAVSGTQVDILKNVVAVKDGLLLFSVNAQFLLTSGDADILSPETGSIVSVSSYKADTNVEPTRVGDQIYFLTTRGEFSGVREYFYESGRDFTQSASITNHVPEFIQDVKGMTGSSTENILILTGNREVFVYQYLYNGEEKIVSAWGRWVFDESEVLYATVFDSFLYLVISRGDFNIRIERMPLSNSYKNPNLPGELCLDEYSLVPDSVTYDEAKNTSTLLYNRGVSVPFVKTPICISGVDNPSASAQVGDRLDPVSIGMVDVETYQIILTGDWRDKLVYVGTTYDFSYAFSQPYLKLAEGDVEIEGRLQVRNYTVSLFDTGNCSFRVRYDDGTNVSSTNTIDNITDWSDIVDFYTLQTSEGVNARSHVYELEDNYPDLNLRDRYNQVTGEFRIPIMSENTQMTLIAESDSWQPVTLSKAQWEGLYHKRSRLL